MKNVVIGILAHVDAGKTTLSEALIYKTGQIRSLGRVDHQDTFLDTDDQERARGITIFSKQAVVKTPDATTFVSGMVVGFAPASPNCQPMNA